MGTKDGDALTVQVDHGQFKATFTCTGTSIAVSLTGPRSQTISNYMVERKEIPRMDLLLSGIEAWSKELFERVLAERGESIASLQQNQTNTDPN